MTGQVRALLNETLSNGLRVAVVPDASSPVVGVALFYDVGSRNEEPGRSGFAHLFEHMMFQGSAHVAKAEHARLIQGWGGSVNGTTSCDRTNYYASVPSHAWKLPLWLEADRMRALAVTAENFENQRQTVMEERRERVDDAPYGQASVRLGELSFGCWAYAHPVIGYWEDLRDAQLSDVQAFHGRWYRPDNAVLAVAGDVDPEQCLETIGAWFGDISAGGERPSPALAQPVRTSPTHETLRDPKVRLPAVMFNHPAPAADHPDFFAWEVLETVLFRGPSSRLHRRLVVDERIALQVSGGYDARRGAGLFGGSMVAQESGQLDALMAAWDQEIDRVVQDGVPPRELEKACNQLRAARVFALESVLNRALSVGHGMLFHDSAHWAAQYLDGLARLQASDVQAAAATVRPEQQVRLVVHP